MSVVNNYLKSLNGSSLTVSASKKGACVAFERQAEKVSFWADKGALEWVEVMHEMLAYSNLCAIVDVEEGGDSLCDRLVNLSVAGVCEISLSGRSSSVVSDALMRCREINKKERLGLRINRACSHIK